MSKLIRSTAGHYWRAVPDNPSWMTRRFPPIKPLNITLQFIRPDARRIWPQSVIIGSGQFPIGNKFPRLTRAGNPSGGSKRFRFDGVTLDTNGAILPSATVKLFRTADNTIQEQSTSDTNGVYVLSSPYADGHFITLKKAGSPNVAGITDDNLTGV